jgi:hypothetical protein
VRLKYHDLYYNYSQKVDIIKALKQTQAQESEEHVLAAFFSFLRERSAGDDLVVLTNSVQLLPLLRFKAGREDIKLLTGLIFF